MGVTLRADRFRMLIRKTLTYLFLVALATLVAAPSIWVVAQSFMNDAQIIKYIDPMAPHGDPHRTFALSRYMHEGTADILTLRIERRQEPQVVDALEPGRTLLRESLRPAASESYRTDVCGAARRWFARIAQVHRNTELAQEAANRQEGTQNTPVYREVTLRRGNTLILSEAS